MIVVDIDGGIELENYGLYGKDMKKGLQLILVSFFTFRMLIFKKIMTLDRNLQKSNWTFGLSLTKCFEQLDNWKQNLIDNSFF